MAYYSILIFVSVLSLAYTSQDSLCSPFKSFYESSGCTKIQIDSNNSCSIKYDCSNMQELSSDQCFYLGEPRKLEEIINGTEEYCRFGCSCRDMERGVKVVCAAVTCPQYYQRLEPGCFHSMGHDCCPEKVVCNNTSISCTYNGETYKEGVTFNPEPCSQCVCDKGWTGKIESPFCKKMKCVSDHKYHNTLLNKCAAIYFKGACCPDIFGCGDGTEVITRTTKTTNPEHTCQFRENVLNIGDEVQLKTPVAAKCRCSVPPLITCETDVDFATVTDLIFT